MPRRPSQSVQQHHQPSRRKHVDVNWDQIARQLEHDTRWNGRWWKCTRNLANGAQSRFVEWLGGGETRGAGAGEPDEACREPRSKEDFHPFDDDDALPRTPRMIRIELVVRFPYTVEGVVAPRRVFHLRWRSRWSSRPRLLFLSAVYLLEQVAPCPLLSSAPRHSSLPFFFGYTPACHWHCASQRRNGFATHINGIEKSEGTRNRINHKVRSQSKSRVRRVITTKKAAPATALFRCR